MLGSDLIHDFFEKILVEHFERVSSGENLTIDYTNEVLKRYLDLTYFNGSETKAIAEARLFLNEAFQIKPNQLKHCRSIFRSFQKSSSF